MPTLTRRRGWVRESRTVPRNSGADLSRIPPLLHPPAGRGPLVAVASVARSDRGEETSPLADGEALGRRARSGAAAWRAAPRSPTPPWSSRSCVPGSAVVPRATTPGRNGGKSEIHQVTSLLNQSSGMHEEAVGAGHDRE